MIETGNLDPTVIYTLSAVIAFYVIYQTVKKVREKIAKKNKPSPIFHPISTYTWTTEEDRLLDKVNEHRVENGLSPLIKDDMHYKMAQVRTVHNIEDGVEGISHDGFGGVREVLLENGLEKVSENLAYGYRYAGTAFNAFIKSEGHEKNMVGPWKYTGISIIEDEDTKKKYYCQIFSK